MSTLPRPIPSLLHGVYPEIVPAATPAGRVSAWLDTQIGSLRARMESAKLSRDATGRSDATWLKVCAGWEKVVGQSPEAPVLRAAKLLCRDRVSVELNCTRSRQHALCLAALRLAVERIPVHLVFAGEKPQEWEELQSVALELGLRVGRVETGDSPEQRRDAYQRDIVAISSRQLIFDYLLDRQKLAGRRGRLKQRLHGALADAGDKPVMRGLNCALLVDTVALLIDAASQPIAISGGSASAGHMGSLYIEAIECAGHLRPAEDYTSTFEMTHSGEERLAQLTPTMGPLWRGSARARSLVQAALHAMSMEEGSDYVLIGEQVRLDPAVALKPGFLEQDYRRFILARHGLSDESQEQGVIQRLCVQHFFTRYHHLSGACSDATLHRRELRSVYALCSLRVPREGDARPIRYRVFRDGSARCNSLQRRVLELQQQGAKVMLLWPDEESRARDLLLCDAQGLQLGNVDYLFEENLKTLDHGFLTQQSIWLVAATSPTNMETDMDIRHRLGQKHGFEVFASSDEELFSGVSRGWRFLLAYNNTIYLWLRNRLLDPQRRRRRQVAEQDAYIRQTLAFSGDRN